MQLPKNVHKKFKGESYKNPPLVRATGLDYIMEHPASSRRMATVHRTVAFTWVRVYRYFRCGRQDSSTLWSTRRRAAGWQQSTGLLHLHGFESVARIPKKRAPSGALFFGAGDRTRTCTAKPEEPKSTESTNSTMPAYLITGSFYHFQKFLSTSVPLVCQI